MKLGIEKTATIRVRTGISYALTEAKKNTGGFTHFVWLANLL
jgi:hypothetical protein